MMSKVYAGLNARKSINFGASQWDLFNRLTDIDGVIVSLLAFSLYSVKRKNVALITGSETIAN